MAGRVVLVGGRLRSCEVCVEALEFLALHDVEESHEEDFHLKPPTAVLEVVEVELQTAEHLLQRVAIAIVERGVGGDARTDLVEVLVARVALHDLLDVVFALGARADEGHVADKHVVELGQLVEVMGTKETAHACQAAVVLMCGELRPVLLGVELHAAELVDKERTPISPDALLFVDGGTAVLTPHGDVAEEKQGGEDDEADECHAEVEATLQVAARLGHAVFDVVFFAEQGYGL